jgi:hypothetical protein
MNLHFAFCSVKIKEFKIDEVHDESTQGWFEVTWSDDVDGNGVTVTKDEAV